ncbi:protein Atg16l2 isoform X3 [Hemicordylus capensis]|uniref:protein Atg16l2 isoform X3 n=1 Tax=Hemicordylus capensis TaxID=884348 RepID=UPI002303B080|nr:protein Atg16l2 isoform X3 [Hemicordylus capensis]
MAEGGSLCRRRWKRHIVRQLQQRDRAQKALFLDLVQAYNKLLEKSSLLDSFTEKLQAETLDDWRRLPLRPTQEAADPVMGAVLDSATPLVSLKRSHEGHMVQLQTINGELAYRMIEQSALLKAREATLEEQRGRLASLRGDLSVAKAEWGQLKKQAEELSHKNATLKEAYETLGKQHLQKEGEFRQAEEKNRLLVTRLVRRKAEAAEDRNRKNDREPEEAKVDVKEMPSRDVPELENGARLCKRPFRSASATSMSLTRYMDVFKGFFDFRMKRGNSFSTASEHQYCYIPTCVAACLPSTVSDEQEAHLSEVNAIKFSPNSGMLATGGTDRLIRLWNVVGGRLENMQTLEGANGGITSIEFDPSGCHVLAATYNNAAQLWKIGDCKSKEILTGHTDKVTAAKFRSTRHQAVTGSRDRTIKEWDLGKGACSRTINVLSYCNDVVCCDTIIVSGHHDKTIRFWDSRGPHCTQVIPVEGTVTSLNISPDQMHLLSCSRDNALKVIDLRMHNIRQVFRADGFLCGSDWTKAVFSPDKSYALAGSADGTLYLWNMETGKLETSLPGVHRSSVNAVDWGPSGMYIGSVDRCRKVVLWR